MPPENSGGIFDAKRRAEIPALLSISSMFLCFLAHLCKALAAVYGSVRLGLERNLCLTTTCCTNSGEILTGTASCILASITAGLAALGLILEAALCIELLLTSGEHEFLATLFAYQCLVFVHVFTLSFDRKNICVQLLLISPG